MGNRRQRPIRHIQRAFEPPTVVVVCKIERPQKPTRRAGRSRDAAILSVVRWQLAQNESILRAQHRRKHSIVLGLKRKIRDVIETCIFGRCHSIRRQDAAAKQRMLRKPQPKDALFGNRRFTFLRHILTQRSQDPTGITQTQHPAPRNDVVRARCFDGRNHRLHDRYRNLIVVVLRAATQNTQLGPPFKPCHLCEDGDPMNRNWTDKFCFHRIPFTKRRTTCSPISWVRVASS